MPPLEAARREQAPPPPAPRNEWQCPYCLRRGHGQNAHAAYTAGVRHFLDNHDTPPGQETTA